MSSRNGTHLIPHLSTTARPPSACMHEDGGREVPVEDRPSNKYLENICARLGRVILAVLEFCRQRKPHIGLRDGREQDGRATDRHNRLTIFNVNSPASSRVFVPNTSASLFPPSRANLWQYALMASSPPNHLRKSKAA